MIRREMKVLNELGLHARVAAKLTKCIKAHACNVYTEINGKRHNLGSALGVMTTGAKKGDILQIMFEGADEAVVAEEVEKLFAEKFGER